MTNNLTQEQIDMLENTFTYHSPCGDQPSRYEALRNSAKAFAETVLMNTPECDDQSAAIRKIREAVMTANAAIAINEKW